jgi:aminoglycoside phosphotransferase (APT) family kinase protein
MAAENLEKALTAVARRLGGSEARIEGLRRLSGGASQETWSFDLESAEGRRPLILRRTPGGKVAGRTGTAVPLATEAAVIARAARAGIKVPEIVHVLEAADGLGEGYVMSRIEGETIARKILRDEGFAAARPRLAFQCGEALAKIHAIDVAGIDGLQQLGLAPQLKTYLDLYEGMAEPHPVFELAFRWLEDHRPAGEPAHLVHGDFRNGNLIVGPEGLNAVLDWELCHLGDPMEDLGWICVNSWRFGESQNPVGGFGQYQELFEGYESAGGAKVDPARVKYWEVFGTLKWGIMCMLMVSAFRTGVDRSVERAAIGRRASETEIDLLNLLAMEA